MAENSTSTSLDSHLDKDDDCCNHNENSNRDEDDDKFSVGDGCSSISVTATAANEELMWGLFVAAVKSYKCHSLLRPFPSVFLTENGEEDIQQLKDVVGSISTVQLQDFLTKNGSRGGLDAKQLTLLHWIFNDCSYQLKLLSNDRLDDLRKKTEEHICVPDPTFLFEVVHSESNEQKFQSLCGDKPTMFAYHGSRVENFFSILRHGLQGHLNKTSLYGEGTYLSSEPTVAIGFSPWISGLELHSLGDSLSILSLCELIRHPSVKCGSTYKDGERTSKRAPNSQGGDVPEKYFVVTNNEMVRVKYLLIYAKPRSFMNGNKEQVEPVRPAGWCRRNKQVIMLLLYLLVLLLIGLVNSKRFWSKMQQYYEDTFNLWDWLDNSRAKCW